MRLRNRNLEPNWTLLFLRFLAVLILMTAVLRDGPGRGELALGVLLALVIASAIFGMVRLSAGKGWWRLSRYR